MDLVECAKCNLEIKNDGSKVKANSRFYHVDCFICGTCKKSIANAVYDEEIKMVESDDAQSGEVSLPKYTEQIMLTCLECLAKGQRKKCSGCKSWIELGAEMIRGVNKIWHPPCFVCENCRCSLANTVYFIRGGKAFCVKGCNRR